MEVQCTDAAVGWAQFESDESVSLLEQQGWQEVSALSANRPAGVYSRRGIKWFLKWVTGSPPRSTWGAHLKCKCLHPIPETMNQPSVFVAKFENSHPWLHKTPEELIRSPFTSSAFNNQNLWSEICLNSTHTAVLPERGIRVRTRMQRQLRDREVPSMAEGTSLLSARSADLEGASEAPAAGVPGNSSPMWQRACFSPCQPQPGMIYWSAV